MSNVTAPPASTVAEKIALFAAFFAVAVLFAIPVTRDALADSLLSTARFVADTTVNGARALWVFLGSIFGA